MKYAADFRRIALDALRGKWLFAVAAGLIAALLGGVEANAPEVKLNLDGGASLSLEYAGKTILSTNQGLNPEWGMLFAGATALVALAAIVLAVLYFVLGSVMAVGYASFNLDLVDGVEPKMETLFSHFFNWKTTTIAKLLRTVYVFLWSLLLFIPGIIASYSYAMTDYILAEHPGMSPSDAIAMSKQMMEGNRFRLFCLQISFIGWAILSGLTFGIGELWLRPYREAASAAFYREISGC